VKPDGGCQGKGIFLTRSLDKILTMNKPDSNQSEPTNCCVVQRYIRKPLLIDGLKFDLRLYILLTRSVFVSLPVSLALPLALSLSLSLSFVFVFVFAFVFVFCLLSLSLSLSPALALALSLVFVVVFVFVFVSCSVSCLLSLVSCLLSLTTYTHKHVLRWLFQPMIRERRKTGRPDMVSYLTIG
jgi:hypothetical protein